MRRCIDDRAFSSSPVANDFIVRNDGNEARTRIDVIEKGKK